jgi:hypothetical protein
MTMNNELERMWKEVVVLYKILCQNLPVKTDENHEKLGIDPGQDLNQTLSRYKSETVLLEPACSVG